jgi:hypothetical protein
VVERVSRDFAMMAIVGEGARTRPDPWPSLGIVTIDPDAYFGSDSLLEGEQNIDLPRMGSEQDDCRMLPNQPLKIPHHHFHPYPRSVAT